MIGTSTSSIRFRYPAPFAQPYTIADAVQRIHFPFVSDCGEVSAHATYDRDCHAGDTHTAVCYSPVEPVRALGSTNVRVDALHPP